MRILHLTPNFPYAPGGNGGATRQFHLLRRLVELGHEVTVVAPVPEPARSGAALLINAGVRLVPVHRPRSREQETLLAHARDPRLAAALARRPLHAWQVGVFWASMRPLALREIEERRPDVICVEYDAAAGWVGDLPPEIPAVLTFQDVSSRYYAARAAAAQGPTRTLLALEAARVRGHHRRWLGRYRRLVCVSDVDAAHVRREQPSARVAVVPNGVDLAAFRERPEVEGPPCVLFTGTMNYGPNVEGVEWFARSVWPAVIAARPEARLSVVGRDPAPGVRRLAELPGIEVTGAVPDVAPWFERAHVAVVPILSGGGTRLKALEAAACGRAMVATTVGVEGLDLAAGRDLLVADDPPGFAAAVLELLEHPERRASLAAAARRRAEESYGWRALAERLARVLSEAVAEPGDDRGF